jgi:ribosomal protein S18 acetylase RimI-like enzyme
MTFQLLDGRQAAGSVTELQALHGEVYGGLPGGDSARERIAGRFEVQVRQPGFVLAEARSGGYLVGYATGMPLRPSTSWWRDLTAPLPDDVTTEHQGRTFALTDLAVRSAWRKQGIGRCLHDLILRGRREERATLVVPPTATTAEAAFLRWGWRRVARTRGGDSGSPAADVLLREVGRGDE